MLGLFSAVCSLAHTTNILQWNDDSVISHTNHQDKNKNNDFNDNLCFSIVKPFEIINFFVLRCHGSFICSIEIRICLNWRECFSCWLWPVILVNLKTGKLKSAWMEAWSATWNALLRLLQPMQPPMLTADTVYGYLMILIEAIWNYVCHSIKTIKWAW